MNGPRPEIWQRLMVLLEPIHDRARLTARRLAGSSTEGDDLFQEALLRALDRLSSLREPERFGGWFYSVLLSVHRNRCRRPFWKRFVPLDRMVEEGWEPADPRAAVVAHEGRHAARMARALATLPAVQREAIVLHDIDGLSLAEIAAIQRVTISAVKTRVVRGRERLRRHYDRLGIGPAAPPRSATAKGVVSSNG